MADAHHHTTRDDQGCGGKTELFRAEQSRDHDIAPGLHLAVDLYHDAVAHSVEHERLLSLG